MPSLVLGTVQLGMPYGVANTTGQPDQKMAIEIVRAAWEGGIREFDTAQEYGESERVLGVAFRELGITDQVKVVSKLATDVDVRDGEAVRRAVQGSIARLRVSKLYGLLVHKEELLDMWKLHNSPRPPLILRGGEFVECMGISVYSPERALQAIRTDGVRIVQIPSNILDRRFERAHVFERAQERGVEMYVRSIFLQGLLLMESVNLPVYMEFAQPIVERMDALATEFGVSRLALALQYVKTAFPDAHIVVGAETVEQVHENVAAWNTSTPEGIVEHVRKTFNDVDEQVLDPRKWLILYLQHLVITQKLEKADAIVWLQGNRYDRGPKVLELFRMKCAPCIVVTGNNIRVVEEDDVHMDDIVRWLNEQGVSQEAIIIDDQSMNTKDQAEHIIVMAIKQNWRRIILVGSTHHQLRAFLTFLKQAQQQGWDGRIINQPVMKGWDERVSGRNQTVREAFEEEIKKIYTYRDLASIEDGLNYFGV